MTNTEFMNLMFANVAAGACPWVTAFSSAPGDASRNEWAGWPVRRLSDVPRAGNTYCTVSTFGDMLRIKHAALLAEFSRAGVFQRLVLSSADSLFAQCCAIGACERVHSIRQRLIRWLLLFDDRIPNRDLGVTQAALSQLIGVRRASVSEAASGLQAQEFIAYQRGHIKIVDREGLEAGACRCYREIKRRSLSRPRGD